MAGGIDWFRWHHGSVTDPKFQLVAKKAGVRLPDVLAVWAFVLEQASASDERGDFGELDVEAMDLLFGFDDGDTQAILQCMDARGLLQGRMVTAWSKRQPKRERDDPNAAERKRAQRVRESVSDVTESETEAGVTEEEKPCHTKSRQVTPRGEERREEKNSPSLRSGEASPRGSRLAADWVLPEEWRDWARSERPDLDPDAVASSFSDHWHGKAGKDARKADWRAVWRNWVRNERRVAMGRPPPHVTAESFRERDQRQAAERAAEAMGRKPPASRQRDFIDMEASHALPARLG